MAIGDVHGDLDAFRDALRLGGAIDGNGHWTGGELVVVQTGDVLDRGDDEPEILALITALEGEAAAAGGALIALSGNHEIMNAQRDFRYVTPDGFRDFASFRAQASRRARDELPTEMEGRAGAFEPGRVHARAYAARLTAVVVGDTVFVHGGLDAEHAARGLDAINAAARSFYLGEGPISPLLAGEGSPIWSRLYGGAESAEVCAELTRALATLEVRRMVIGHTVQDAGINAICDGRVQRIDVGLAAHYGGPIQVLELRGDEVNVLRGAE